MSTVRRLAPPVAWLAALTVVLWWALRVPIGPAGTPGLADPLELVQWLPSADPAVVVAGIIRAVVVTVTAWLLVTSALATAAALLRQQVVLAAVLRVSPAVVRRVVGSTAAVVITATSLVAAPAGATEPAEHPPAEATLRFDAGASDLTATLRLVPPEGSTGAAHDVEPATLRLLPPEGSTGSAHDVEPATLALLPGQQPTADRTAAAPDTQTTSEEPNAERPATWTVRPGDSFWRIAEEVLALDRDQPPEDDFVDYWQRLIDANRSQLVDVDNPDLLLPGQVLTVP